MSLLDFFKTNQKAPKWNPFYSPSQNINDDEIDLPHTLYEEDTDIIGASFGIEYIDSKGVMSNRWISVNSVYEKDGAASSLLAHCYVKERPRQFRFDRIKTVYDDSGIVMDTATFFADYGIMINAYTPPPKQHACQLKKVTRDQVRVLVAISRIDGEMHENEIDEIIIYSVKLLENRGEFQTPKDISAFTKYVRNMYPTPEVINTSLGRITKYTDRGKKEFLQMCERVMNADAIQKEAEFNLIMQIRDRLYH